MYDIFVLSTYDIVEANYPSFKDNLTRPATDHRKPEL